ncbi:MFS transporter [Novosphingobium sp. 1949]|uniref:MFS transporter n=1 Tax=Novosphingobium organovorum TaxID=2930092 RepID=A0ABT0BBM0_9SPHN|nr:MFS transporter [Novosphingobium organovorum]MCJ2182428.1 MFS transporter [Novosphingobium organovorum]
MTSATQTNEGIALFSQSANPVSDQALFNKVARRLIPFLFISYLIAQVDKMNVGFAKLTMLNDLGFSDIVYGLGAGMFFIGYVLFEVPSNIALRRFGAPRWLGRIMISWGLLSVAMLFVHSPTSFYSLRFLIGIAEAGFFPGVIYYLTLWFPAERRTRMTAMFMSAIALAGVVVGPVSGLILETLNGFAGLRGWQWLFIIEGTPAIVLGVIAIAHLDNGPDEARWLTTRERERIKTLVASEASTRGHAPLKSVLLNGRVLLLSLVYGCYGTSFFGFVFWLPTIIENAGVQRPLLIGILSTIPWIAGAVTMLGLATFVKRREQTTPLLIALALLAALGWAASPSALSSLPMAMLFCSLAMAGTMGSLPLFWNLPTAMFSGMAAAAAIALISALGNIPGFLSPYMVGWVKTATGSFALPMYIFASGMLLVAIILFILQRPTSDD